MSARRRPTYPIPSPWRIRSASSRHGPAIGLVHKRDQSGDRDPQLRITNTFLRRLLVSSAQYILGPFGPDCDLRRWGLRLAERGCRNAKKRAVVAVARKLQMTGQFFRLFTWRMVTPFSQAMRFYLIAAHHWNEHQWAPGL